MKKNTVLLSLEDYNDLRDFKEKITNDEILVWNYYSGVSGFMSKDEAIKKIAEINEEISNELNKLKYPDSGKETIKDVQKMSIWQFIKWRKSWEK